MERVESFITLLREKSKLQHEKYKKEENEQDLEKMEIIDDLIQGSETFNQTKENTGKNLNFLTSNKHAVYKVIQEAETTKGLPISSEFQQQALNVIKNSITYINDFKNIHKNLEADKNLELSKPAIEILRSTRTIENDLRKLRSSLNQNEALQSKVEQFKSNLFITEGDNQQDLDDSIFS